MTIVNNASEQLQRKYLPIVASGQKMGCYGLTEPGTGSDAAAIQCQARKVEGGYLINGRKRYTSFAHLSAYIILFALTQSAQETKGISAFVFPTDTAGYRVIERVPCLGLRGPSR